MTDHPVSYHRQPHSLPVIGQFGKIVYTNSRTVVPLSLACGMQHELALAAARSIAGQSTCVHNTQAASCSSHTAVLVLQPSATLGRNAFLMTVITDTHQCKGGLNQQYVYHSGLYKLQ